jgi:hypothetical protein
MTIPLSIALVLYKLAEFFYLQLPECPSPHGLNLNLLEPSTIATNWSIVETGYAV